MRDLFQKGEQGAQNPARQETRSVASASSSASSSALLAKSPPITPQITPPITPMMAQYLEIKAQYADALLFYRMGDFYELFFDDAIEAAAVLDIALTHRSQHQGKNIPMCGVPFHAAEGYLQRLIRKGYRVAVCEQMEDPQAAKARGSKAVVKREVVRLITPGTLSEDNLLDARSANYLAALGAAAGKVAVAWVDMSTGEFYVSEPSARDLNGLMARIAPREILCSDLPDTHILRIEDLPAQAATPPIITSVAPLRVQAAADLLRAQFQDLGDGLSRAQQLACGHILAYVRLTQMAHMPRLRPPYVEAENGVMVLDAATRANLELSRKLSGEKGDSLLAVIDFTTTAAGARLLAQRLAAPLTHLPKIQARHRAVAYMVEERALCDEIRQHLKQAPDMVRALSRLVMARGGPRDLQILMQGLAQARTLHRLLGAAQDLPDELKTTLADLTREQKQLDAFCATLEESLAAQMPMLARDGGFVREGYHAGLDAARQLRDESRRVIASLQQKYAAATGIKALKIKHNGVLGYHIDVPASQGDKLMCAPHQDVFIHRQTLASSVRFSSQELASLAGEISRAAETALALELEIFATLCAQAVALGDAIEVWARSCAKLDVATALAELAATHNWVCPSMYDDMRFEIEGGRHPVVEAALAATEASVFIANDCRLDATAECDPRLILLTGPNMAGKSTFLRQNALIAILAQMGSFVPARAAHIGLIDRVFSRVGAADDLARGRSTFMVEMVETAAIIHYASPRALVILDEIGRGTATFDGLSIAWAVVEHLHEAIGCRTLFATHYHELTVLAERLAGVANASMRVREHNGDLVFLHEVAAGAADRSYGIYVAQLAGLPPTVIARARDILSLLEANKAAGESANRDGDRDGVAHLPLYNATPPVPPHAPLPAPASDPLRNAVADIDADALTPREALTWLYRLKDML